MARDMTITARVCDREPDYSLAWLLGDSIRQFYEDPENVKAFEKWEKEYDRQERRA